jgi:titin
MRDDDVSELSPASSSVATPAALVVPAAPTGLTAVAQSPTAVGLTWTDNAMNETAYKVYRRDGTYIVFGQVSPDLPAGTTGWQDTTVAPSSYYTYVVKAVNAAGDSGWSNEATVTTPAAPVPVPAVPTNLVASAGSPTIVKLTWTDNATNESAYLIERAVGAGAFVALGSELSAGTTEWGDMNAMPSTSYRYRVKARNAGGDSAWSNEASATTPSDVQTVVIKLIIDKKNYTINGISMMMDVAPVILESRTLGPVRYVAEALGADVAWDPVERKVTVTLGSKTVELWIDKNTARVDGAYMLIDPQNPDVKPVILPPGRTMLPFRFIAEQLGAGVGWDPVKREVTITYPAP